MNRKTLVMILCVLGAALVGGVAGFLSYVNSFHTYAYVYPNVTCMGRNLGGMTYQEAQEAIRDLPENLEFSVDLTLPDGKTCRITPDQAVTEMDPGISLEEAWEQGREDESFFGPYQAYRQARETPTEVSYSYTLTYDPLDVERQVKAFADEVYTPPTDCAAEIHGDTHTVTVTLGQQGRELDIQAAARLVCQALDDRQDAVEMDYTPVPLNDYALWRLLRETAGEAAVEPTEPHLDYDETTEICTVHVGLPGYRLRVDDTAKAVGKAEKDGAESVTVELEEIPPAPYDIEGFYQWVYRPPENRYFYQYGTLVGGEPGYDLDLPAAQAALAAADYGEDVAVPLIRTPPTLSYWDAQAALFRDRLGSADTYHTGESNRTHNLVLACQAIDGTIINPGEEFSFNGIVGERTADKGYRSGIVYVDNKSEPQLGGGICQVASTCYMAALRADMEITHREEHMFPVTYCPLGLDATVYWGSVDFSFRNSWRMPIRINAGVWDGQVHVSIDGSNFSGQYVSLSSERVSAGAGYTAYRAYQTVYNADGSVYATNDLGVSTYKNH